jgi:hypothetical protein
MACINGAADVLHELLATGRANPSRPLQGGVTARGVINTTVEQAPECAARYESVLALMDEHDKKSK